jgi:hypothetical protein
MSRFGHGFCRLEWRNRPEFIVIEFKEQEISKTTKKLTGKLPNSTINCRQIPQGAPPLGSSVTTTIPLNFLCPLETALTTALCSAQMVPPKEAFSTLTLNI